jgi:signal transduction histidine kinase
MAEKMESCRHTGEDQELVSLKELNCIFNAMTDLITIHDKDFNIIYANKAAIERLEIHPSALSTAKCYKYYHNSENPPDLCPSCECLKTMKPGSFEFFEPHLDMHVEIRVLPRFDADNQLQGLIHIVRDITERKLAEQEIIQKQEQLRSLSMHMESVREEERRRISREIHDELGQALTALNMDISWLTRKLRTLLDDKTRSMTGLVDKTIKTVQRISSELRPGLLDTLGLMAAIEYEVDKYKDLLYVRLDTPADMEDNVLAPEMSVSLYRILQEAMTNIVRHARATRARVSIQYGQGEIILKIADNGKGITREQMSGNKSFGLIGMRAVRIPLPSQP